MSGDCMCGDTENCNECGDRSALWKMRDLGWTTPEPPKPAAPGAAFWAQCPTCKRHVGMHDGQPCAAKPAPGGQYDPLAASRAEADQIRRELGLDPAPPFTGEPQPSQPLPHHENPAPAPRPDRRVCGCASSPTPKVCPACTTSGNALELAAIAEAHPQRTGRHDLYAEAMLLVGERHAKGDLVDLVTWLLLRIEEKDK